MQVLDSLIDGPLRLRNRREGDELIGMIVRYLRTGEEPEPRTDTQEAVLTAIRPVMETSRSRIVAGGNGGKSSSNDASKAESKRPSKTGSKPQSKSGSKTSSELTSKAESKRPSEEEEEEEEEKGLRREGKRRVSVPPLPPRSPNTPSSSLRTRASTSPPSTSTPSDSSTSTPRRAGWSGDRT